ncbi:hypothetical protein Lal_00021357, partial [Lupinus albus]
MVGMRKDPKVGGGVGGTCIVTKDQTQHSPRTTDHLEANAANIYNNRPNQQQQNYDQSSSRYNPVINNPPPAPCEPSLEVLNYDKLPSWTVINPKNVSVITLRLGKQIELPTSTPDSTIQKDDDIGRHIHASTRSYCTYPIAARIVQKSDSLVQVQGTLSMEFDHIVVQFNILDDMKHQSEDHFLFHIDVLDELINEHIYDFIIDSDSLSLIASHICHACTNYELYSSCNDDFWDITIDPHDI